jgi:hypothetical protein
LNVIFRRLIALVFAAGLLASCSTISSATDAFSVEDTSWSREKFNAFLTELIEAGQLNAVVGGASSEDARAVATILIRQEAINVFLKSQGQSITDADRNALVATLSPGDPFYSYSQTLQDALLQINAAPTALARVGMPTAQDLAALYNTLPASAGVVCLSHIVVNTRDEANAALKRLRNGEKFAKVAKDVSIEPAAATTGGALANQEQGNPCFTLNGLSQVNFDPLFVTAALSARAGIPTGPAKSSFGYHIILNAPWNEVSDAVTALVSASPGPVLSQGYLISTNISVASSIGRWNTATGQVE